jgi:hypothetical protein
MRDEKGSWLTGGWQAGQSREAPGTVHSDLASLPVASWPVAFLL